MTPSKIAKDDQWIEFAAAAVDMMRVVKHDRRAPLKPLIDYINSSAAISDDEIRTDLENALYELGGSPYLLDQAMRLL